MNLGGKKIPGVLNASLIYSEGELSKLPPRTKPPVAVRKANVGRDHKLLLQVGDNDVVCGRGNICNKHAGNRRFRRIINENKLTYARCEKNSHKHFLALSIVIAIERKGGRFLKLDNKTKEWIKIPRKESVAKAAQALRDQLQGIRGRGRSSASSRKNLDKKQLLLNSLKQGIDRQYSNGSDDNTSLDENASHCSNESGDFCERSIMTTQLVTKSQSSEPQPDGTPSMPFASATPQHVKTFWRRTQNQSQPLVLHQHDNSSLWVPKELEALMLSSPDAVQAIATL